MGSPDGDTVPPRVDDDLVIDLRDGVTDPLPPTPEEEIVDLRDRPIPVADPTETGAEAAEDLVPSRGPSGRPDPLPPGCRMVTITGGDLWMEAEAFVYDSYREVGFCEPSPRRRVEELARWHDASTFHAVLAEDDSIIGTIRTITGDYDDLPIGKFTRTDFRHPNPVSELSSLTVRSDVRSTGVIERLYRAGWIAGCRAGTSATVALIDDWLLDVFHQTYRLFFKVVGEAQPHMGGEPIPVALTHGDETYLPLLQQNPGFWAWLLEAVRPEEAEEWGLPLVLEDGTRIQPGSDIAVHMA
ncbi:MAG TPA: hypothetical protein VFU19_07170 [Iamia sp.]|nr:hypothetical protein [Iamia sp.]